jgi:hypothetical protein
MKSAALTTLINIAMEHVDGMPRSKQIETFHAVAEVAPSAKQRQLAGRIAFALEEATKMQSEFIGKLFPETDGKPNHKDGE